MRICHVITGIQTGGAETALCRLLESTVDQGVDHSVFVLGNEGALSPRVRSTGARLFCLGMTSYQDALPALMALRRQIRGVAPDVLQGWMYHANLASTAISVMGRLPVVWGVRHSLHDLSADKPATRAVIRLGAHLSWSPRAIVYNSAIGAAQHEAIGYVRSKSVVIHNGFDTSDFRPDDARRARIRHELDLSEFDIAIGLVARVHPVKDHRSFLRAAAIVARTVPKAIFVLVGEGACAENHDLCALVASLQLQDKIRLCGRRSDVAAVNAALDIACSSSSAEAFPNAIAEAMACAVPCVATDVGDVKEIIGQTGVPVPPRDPVALAEGIRRLAALGREERRKLGQLARHRIVERYSLKSMARKHVELYRSLRGT
jgi:glycosyltransferase involved in cell wall biosynthesis